VRRALAVVLAAVDGGIRETGWFRKAAGMRFSAESTSDGVTERLFTIGDVPGVVWAAAGAAGPRPLVLLGHGGGDH